MQKGFSYDEMDFFSSLLTKLGLRQMKVERHPIRVFLLDDDTRRHEWFSKRFKGDVIDVADNVEAAQEYLSANAYDAIFLDHDLHPEHYHAKSHDDERTGFAIASWLAANPELQRASRSEEHTSELQSQSNLVCRLLLEKKKKNREMQDEL